MSDAPGPIQLETYEMVLLRRTRGYGDFGDEDRERIFREHLVYVRDLVGSGQQLAAGPVRDSPAAGEPICGLGLFQRGSLAAVRALMDNDPGVRQGLYCYDVMLWQTPAGGIAFPNRVPPP